MTTFQIPKTQKAAVLRTVKGEYTIETDWPVTQPGELKPGECLVKLEYSGVCHSDLHIKDGDWARGPVLPLVGGHEGIGIVVAIGEHTSNPAAKIGDRVGLKWIAGVCETCEFCRTGYESACNFCRVKGIHGFQIHGTFQEYAVSYVNYVTKIPEGFDSASAAPILCAGMTVYKAIKTSGARIGQWIAITGAGGGLGHLAVQYAVAQGLRVVAIDTGESKRELVMSLGAEKWVDFRETKNLIADVQAATGGPGPQAAVIATGNAEPFSQAAMYLKSTGTLMCVGMPAGLAALNIPITLVISKCLRIIGTAIGNRQDADEAMDLAAQGKVRTRLETRKLEDLNAVFKDMAEGKITGRIVLKI
ncbi:Alcohol dehydrogenase 1 [Leucoagaricus sp. SymC.cos]|nr:Alcohol dehydrogenase 1 [Leucoagaricus sp. SymC.cos]